MMYRSVIWETEHVGPLGSLLLFRNHHCGEEYLKASGIPHRNVTGVVLDIFNSTSFSSLNLDYKT